MENWPDFMDWASKGLLSGICMYGVHILSEMKKSIDSLNATMAKIMERTEWHSKEISRIDERISQIVIKKQTQSRYRVKDVPLSTEN